MNQGVETFRLSEAGIKEHHPGEHYWPNCVYYPGPRPTNISIELKIRTKYAVLWFKMYVTDHNEIFHNCRDVCKILLRSVEQIFNYSTPNFDPFSNSIEIPLVVRGLVQHL